MKFTLLVLKPCVGLASAQGMLAMNPVIPGRRGQIVPRNRINKPNEHQKSKKKERKVFTTGQHGALQLSGPEDISSLSVSSVMSSYKEL